jgi:hypothetical protein
MSVTATIAEMTSTVLIRARVVSRMGTRGYMLACRSLDHDELNVRRPKVMADRKISAILNLLETDSTPDVYLQIIIA